MVEKILIELLQHQERALLERVRGIFREELERVKKEDLQEKFLSPKEVCKLFSPKISLATLNTWADRGFLHKHYIGQLTFYKYSEVIASLGTLKKYKQ